MDAGEDAREDAEAVTMTRHQVEKLRSMMMSKTAIEFLDRAASGETTTEQANPIAEAAAEAAAEEEEEEEEEE
eukprot:SAG25_NODE_104_length_15398_cov_15.424472_7_plen_73_part_00